MTIDTTPLGALSAEVMEAIEEQYGDDYTVRTVAVVVEVDSKERGQMIARCSDDRPWLLSALLTEARDMVDDLRHELASQDENDDA